jgi:group I intron endonuclease
MYSVYKIVNKTNGNEYVGVTTQSPPNRRFTAHKYQAKKLISQSTIHRAIRKYGASNFNFEILEMGENNEYGYVAERLYVAWLKPTYNETAGGEGSRGHTFQARKNRAEQMRGKKLPLVWRKAISIGQLGNIRGPHTPEHSLLQSIGQLGRKDTLRAKENKRLAALKRWFILRSN